ncbi:hypothetical protein DXT57_08290 [Stenotrophomonas maltophilia]|nr:hypothetical protein AYX08_10780 [Stenotrophomonas maltophilia]MBA0262308.1 hypothetical protein [Stenotrophomonas maltophilia]OBU73716.1 hypothetical protein A9K61_05510 [Stenotrophomonas maltophilia]OWB46468.1 hypothetical protein B7H27_10025 [Stenotrophomonas maltophilia]QBL45576.1 hypothetical protein LBG_13705 [Stenotrophomonas maltophilia]
MQQSRGTLEHDSFMPRTHNPPLEDQRSCFAIQTARRNTSRQLSAICKKWQTKAVRTHSYSLGMPITLVYLSTRTELQAELTLKQFVSQIRR